MFLTKFNVNLVTKSSKGLNTIVRLSSTSAVNDSEWKNAKPYSQIPGLTKFGLVRAVSPGGKYNNLNIIEMSLKMQEEYGNFVKFPGLFGQRDLIFTLDPNDIETIFRHEGKFPIRRGLDTLEYYREVYRREWFGKGNTGLVPSQGDDWYQFRTRVNQTMMQPKTSKLYIPKIDEVAIEFVDRIKENRDANGETPNDFLEYINQWALESIALITLDTRLMVHENPRSAEINRLMKEVFRLSYEYDVMPSLWRTVKTPGFMHVMKTYDRLTGIMREYANEAMKKLEASTPSDDHEPGILEKLMKIDKNVAFVMVLDSLLAGVDTTSTGIVSTLYCLASNPDKQEILRKEVLKILPEKKSKLTTQSLSSIPYLRAVIKEAIRLHPPFNGNLRETVQDMVIQGYQIPKGTNLVLGTHILPIQDEHFERSNEFIPERWIKDNTDTKCPHAKDSHPFAYLPFGFGSRMCVGRRFAELEIEVLTMRIIREFKLEWNNPPLKFKSFTLNIAADPLKFKTIDL
ncbi:CLUMA_CG015847, isoform A [Clunio marinus]|uniref:CLUMA_CG015847, isoform A n=1 Tax=Clunio marinus TaxID=568069 RepID=A0A1J1IUR9_9DIPT|nr:CLUMA_CG015847, isoform A [Clunio marinus]